MAALKRSLTGKKDHPPSTSSGAPDGAGDSKYWLTADLFDFLNPDHPWKARGNQLTVSHVVDDPKHSTTAGKQQKKLAWLLQHMQSIADDPATLHRPLESQLSLILAYQHLESTVFSIIPKSKQKDQWLDELRRMITKMTIDAAKQLTMDTRAVLHEFKNLGKTFEFVREISKEIGIFYIDDYTNEDGTIKPKEFVERFKQETKKEFENLGRIKLPFTREASAKLAVCARHSRPLVAQALTVHSQDVYNLAYDLLIELKSYAAIVNQKIDICHSSLDKTQFLLFANGQADAAQMFYPRKFPRFLPNLSLADPDGFLVGDLESYKMILSAYADYTQQLDAMLEPWNELAEMLEMWQRTCCKANPNLVTKGPIPEIKPQQLNKGGNRSMSYSYSIPPTSDTTFASTSPPTGGFNASALLINNANATPSSNPTVNTNTSMMTNINPTTNPISSPSSGPVSTPQPGTSPALSSSPPQSELPPQTLPAQYFVASPSPSQSKVEPRQSAFMTNPRPGTPLMMSTLPVPEPLPPLPITPNYNRVNEEEASEMTINRFGEETLAKALADMDAF